MFGGSVDFSLLRTIEEMPSFGSCRSDGMCGLPSHPLSVSCVTVMAFICFGGSVALVISLARCVAAQSICQRRSGSDLWLFHMLGADNSLLYRANSIHVRVFVYNLSAIS